MGELSARHLRGDSMADVIFNGSSSRKPVGTASVELVFDNSYGKIGGAYASYAEISLKRLVARDGSSSYFINGGRCRRKDITQLFLGTGLGSRSYAIIEQGMISRVIEARADDMRAFIEEAAGISLYKERRRETEGRILDTRDNLARVQDLRDEVDKQIRHLQRQAAAARRFQELRARERKLHAELLALRMRELDGGALVQDGATRARELAMQQGLAEQRSCEAALAKQRTFHEELIEQLEGQLLRLQAQADRLLLEQEAVGTLYTGSSVQQLTEREASAGELAAVLEGRLATALAEAQRLRGAQRESEQRLDQLRAQRDRVRAELMSVDALQRAALSEKDTAAAAWLEELGVRLGSGVPARLAGVLSVDPGWEHAVETVLGDYLEAVCVGDLDQLGDELNKLASGSVAFLETGVAGAGGEAGTLAARVRGPEAVLAMLSRVRTTEALAQGRRERGHLAPGETRVTAAGEWIGRHWLRSRNCSASMPCCRN